MMMTKQAITTFLMISLAATSFAVVAKDFDYANCPKTPYSAYEACVSDTVDAIAQKGKEEQERDNAIMLAKSNSEYNAQVAKSNQVLMSQLKSMSGHHNGQTFQAAATAAAMPATKSIASCDCYDMNNANNRDRQNFKYNASGTRIERYYPACHCKPHQNNAQSRSSGTVTSFGSSHHSGNNQGTQSTNFGINYN
jgi:hypothetical protein